METVIEVSDLCKFYTGVAAVDGVSLSVGRGEVFGVLGPNGAGKTTAAECVAGLRRPDGGSVRVLGLDPARDPAAARDAGLLPRARVPAPPAGQPAASLADPRRPRGYPPHRRGDRTGLARGSRSRGVRSQPAGGLGARCCCDGGKRRDGRRSRVSTRHRDTHRSYHPGGQRGDLLPRDLCLRVVFPTEALPELARRIGQILPFTYGVRAIREAWTLGTMDWTAFAVLAATVSSRSPPDCTCSAGRPTTEHHDQQLTPANATNQRARRAG